jgi:dihydroorotase
MYELLIKGGEVIIPSTGYRGHMDIAIAQGCVAALGASLAAEDAVEVVDAAGLLVVPGLIDLHTHLGFELHTQVVDPDQVCPPAGVTTAVDQGSTGAFTFPWYRERVLSRALIRLYPFINISSIGTISIDTPYYNDNYGRYIDIPDTIRMIEENRASIRGIKVFASSQMVGPWPLDALRAARQVADRVGVPIAVHISVAPPPLEEVLTHLTAGDIITHSYTIHDQGILDKAGHIRPAVREARARGIHFDLGHGAGSFNLDVARKALAQEFPPDTISTDIYHINLETPVKDLPTTLSKFLNLGMPLEEVIARATLNAARAIREPSLGSIEVGKPADLAILRLREARFGYVDSQKNTLEGPWNLQCAMTVVGGRIIYRQ